MNVLNIFRGMKCVFSDPQPFEASDLLLGLNFSKVLTSLVALNKVTAGESQ